MRLVVEEALNRSEQAQLLAGGVEVYLPGALLPQDVDAVVCRRAEAMGHLDCPRLRWIHILSAGYDGIDLTALRSRGIILTNAKGVYSRPIAEDALLKMLLLARRYDVYLTGDRSWTENVGQTELYGKTAVILGAGSIGRQIAKLAKAFGMTVLGYDPVMVEPEGFDAVEHGEVVSPELLTLADYLILSLPLTDKTYHIMDESTLGRLKPGACLINIARGALVCTDALVRALRENRLRAAALDVLEEEPLPPDSSLWDVENLLLTPHQAYVGEMNHVRNKALWMRNALALSGGKQLLNRVV